VNFVPTAIEAFRFDIEEGSVHNRTPVLLTFSVKLPSTTATGRWRERGRMGDR
jgi:hypothetical protein